MSEHVEKLFKLAYKFYLAPDDLAYQVNHYQTVENEFLVLLELLDEDSAQSDPLSHYAETLKTDVNILRKAARKFLQHYLLVEAHSHYQTLGVSSDADAGLIRRHYRYLIGLFHPDKKLVDSDRYALRINQAYNVLKRPSRRKEYDKSKPGKTITGQPIYRQATEKGQQRPQQPAKQKFVSGMLDALPGFRSHPEAWVWSAVLAIAVVIVYNPFVKTEIELTQRYVSADEVMQTSPVSTVVPQSDVASLAEGIARQNRVSRKDQILGQLKQEVNDMLPQSHDVTSQSAAAEQVTTDVDAQMEKSPKPMVSARSTEVAPGLMLADVGSSPATNSVLIADNGRSYGISGKVRSGSRNAVDRAPAAKSQRKQVQNAAKKPAVTKKPALSVAPTEVFPAAGGLKIVGNKPVRVSDQSFYDIVSAEEGEPAVFDVGIPEMVLMHYVSAYESGDAKAIASMFSEVNGESAAAGLEENYLQLFSHTDQRKITIKELIIKPESNSEALMLSDLVLSLQHKQGGIKKYAGKMMFRIVGDKNGMQITGLRHNVR